MGHNIYLYEKKNKQKKKKNTEIQNNFRITTKPCP